MVRRTLHIRVVLCVCDSARGRRSTKAGRLRTYASRTRVAAADVSQWIVYRLQVASVARNQCLLRSAYIVQRHQSQRENTLLLLYLIRLTLYPRAGGGGVVVVLA